MFIEVPNINSVKKNDLFEIIKTKTGLEENVEYYPITPTIIYTLDDRKNNNLISAKLMKKVLEKASEDKGAFKDFSILNIISIMNKETEEVEKKLAILIYEKGDISYDVLEIEKSPILTMVMNFFDNEDMKVLYIENEELSDIIEEVVDITGVDEEIFIPTTGGIDEYDLSLLVDKGSLKNQIDDIKKKVLSLFESKEGKPAKITKKHIIIGSSVLVFLILGSAGVYGYTMYQEKIQAEEAAAKALLNKKVKVKRYKVAQSNLLKVDTIVYLVNKYDVKNFINRKGEIDLKISYKDYVKSNLVKIKVKEKFILGNTILLKKVKFSEIVKVEKLKNRTEKDISLLKIKDNYFDLANELKGMYFETGKKEFVFKTKLSKSELEEYLVKLMNNNKVKLNISITYLRSIGKYSILINAAKSVKAPKVPKPAEKPVKK